MGYGQSDSLSEGKSAYRAMFREEWNRQFHFLPDDRKQKINRDPMCREAQLLFDSVERETERKPATP